MRAATLSSTLLICAAFQPVQAQDADLIAGARIILEELQAKSFAADREFCGMLGRNEDGDIVITQPRRGGRDQCVPTSFRGWFLRPSRVETLASFHTHGSYDPDTETELPSMDDYFADEDEGVIGFVSTPGGRFWMIEPEKGLVRQVCGAGCLPVDPGYDPSTTGPLREVYTASQLQDRLEGLDD